MANCEIRVNNVQNDTKIIVSIHKITGQSLSLVKENLSKGLPIFSKDIFFDDFPYGGIVEQLLDFFQENNIDVTIDYDNKKGTLYEFLGHILKRKLQKIYMLFLEYKGYVPEINEDGNINFKYSEIDEKEERCVIFKSPELDEGDDGTIVRAPYDGICSIQIDSDDYEFFRLVHVGGWGALDEKRLQERLYKAASETNAEMKLTKTFVVEKHFVVVTIETMMKSPREFECAFDRMLTAIRDTLVRFERKMRNTGATA
jgi:hypothetical protein